jgi:hypothetical protein
MVSCILFELFPIYTPFLFGLLMHSGTTYTLCWPLTILLGVEIQYLVLLIWNESWILLAGREIRYYHCTRNESEKIRKYVIVHQILGSLLGPGKR